MGLSLIEKLKLVLKLKQTADAVEKGIEMKDSTKVVAAVIALLTAIVQFSSVQTAIVSFLTAHPAVALSVTGLSALLALIHNPQSTSASDKSASTVAKMLLIGGVLLMGHPVRAQSFTASTSAIGFLDSNKSVGTKLTETLPVHYYNTAQTSYLSVQGTEIINSTLGATSYLGGAEYTPDLASVLKKYTTLTSDNLSVAVSAAVGNTTFSSTTTNHLSWMAGGKLSYKASSTVTAQLFEVGYLSYGITRAPYASSGLLVVFGRK